MVVRFRKFVLVGLMALAALGAMQGSAVAAADGDLDISTVPPQGRAKINPGYVVVSQGAIQVNSDFVAEIGR